MKEEKSRLRRIKELEAAFELYRHNKIENVTMQQVADQAGIGVATVFRHFRSKMELAANVCAYEWDLYFSKAMEGRTPEFLQNVDAISRLGYTFDLYIDLYKNHKDLLRINDDFNHFYHENKNADKIPEYDYVMKKLSARFHDMYLRAKEDGTMRTDIPEDELMRTLLHTMMGTINHYLAGFGWGESVDQDYTAELIRLKEILMDYAATDH